MTKVTRIVLATAAATGLSFSPVFGCEYMKSAQKKPMVTAKADVQTSATTPITLKQKTDGSAPVAEAVKPAEQTISVE